MSGLASINWETLVAIVTVVGAIFAVLLWIANKVFAFGATSQRISHVESEIGEVKEDVGKIKTDINKNALAINKRIDGVNTRIDKVNNRIDELVLILTENHIRSD